MARVQSSGSGPAKGSLKCAFPHSQSTPASQGASTGNWASGKMSVGLG